MKTSRILQTLPVIGAAALGLMLPACQKAENKTTAAAPSVAATAKPTKIIEIKMRGDAKGYYFEPKMLIVRRGEAVRWTCIEGGPHNVNFTNQKLPSGAQVLLEHGGKLLGSLLQAPGQATEIHFTADYPVGEYSYVCDPHLALGMSGKILLQP